MLSGGTPAEGRLSDVRQRQVGRGVAGRDCSFERIRKHLSRDRYGKGKGSRPVRAQARCRTRRSNPASGRKPLGSRFAAVRGAFHVRVGAKPSRLGDVAAVIQRFEDRLQKARPDVKYIRVEPIPRQP